MTPRMKELTVEVCRRRNVKIDMILSDSRLKEHVAARWEIWATAYAIDPVVYSTTRLGLWFRRSHSVVSRSLQLQRRGVSPYHNSGANRRALSARLAAQRAAAS